jgi:hypothetical protein
MFFVSIFFILTRLLKVFMLHSGRHFEQGVLKIDIAQGEANGEQNSTYNP